MHPRPLPRLCSASTDRSASFPIHTATSGPSRSVIRSPSGTSRHSRLGATPTERVRSSTVPGTLTPTPSTERPAATRSSATARPPGRRHRSGEAGSAPVDTLLRAITVPPMPTAAEVTWVTSTSTATTNGPEGCGPTTYDGRPTRSPPIGTRSSTSPSRVRSATRAPTVERLTPSRFVSWARVSSPSRCTSPRISARLWRRMASGRAAGEPAPRRSPSGLLTPVLKHPPVDATARRPRRRTAARCR